MKTRTFYAPEKLSHQIVIDLISLVADDGPAPEQVDLWTDNETLMAYDWAIREHLRASDQAVRRRPRPSFTRRQR